MAQESKGILTDFIPINRVVEKELPDIHVSGEQIGPESFQRIERETPDNKENYHDRHGSDYRTDGIIDHRRE